MHGFSQAGRQSKQVGDKTLCIVYATVDHQPMRHVQGKVASQQQQQQQQKHGWMVDGMQ